MANEEKLKTTESPTKSFIAPGLQELQGQFESEWVAKEANKKQAMLMIAVTTPAATHSTTTEAPAPATAPVVAAPAAPVSVPADPATPAVPEKPVAPVAIAPVAVAPAVPAAPEQANLDQLKQTIQVYNAQNPLTDAEKADDDIVKKSAELTNLLNIQNPNASTLQTIQTSFDELKKMRFKTEKEKTTDYIAKFSNIPILGGFLSKIPERAKAGMNKTISSMFEGWEWVIDLVGGWFGINLGGDDEEKTAEEKEEEGAEQMANGGGILSKIPRIGTVANVAAIIEGGITLQKGLDEEKARSIATDTMEHFESTGGTNVLNLKDGTEASWGIFQWQAQKLDGFYDFVGTQSPAKNNNITKLKELMKKVNASPSKSAVNDLKSRALIISQSLEAEQRAYQKQILKDETKEIYEKFDKKLLNTTTLALILDIKHQFGVDGYNTIIQRSQSAQTTEEFVSNLCKFSVKQAKSSAKGSRQNRNEFILLRSENEFFERGQGDVVGTNNLLTSREIEEGATTKLSPSEVDTQAAQYNFEIENVEKNNLRASTIPLARNFLTKIEFREKGVITSATGGKHASRSRHPLGEAIDIRTNNNDIAEKATKFLQHLKSQNLATISGKKGGDPIYHIRDGVWDYEIIVETIAGGNQPHLHFGAKKKYASSDSLGTPYKDFIPPAPNTNALSNLPALPKTIDKKQYLSSLYNKKNRVSELKDHTGNMLIVDIHHSPQTIYLVNNQGDIQNTMPISGSYKGQSNTADSLQTPSGFLKISEKIGEEVPRGQEFVGKSSLNQKVIADLSNGTGDEITSRILTLNGLEEDNKNASARDIYIHGTAQEDKIGTPASHGCIRMKNDDVIELFNQVQEGTPVFIPTASEVQPS